MSFLSLYGLELEREREREGEKNGKGEEFEGGELEELEYGHQPKLFLEISRNLRTLSSSTSVFQTITNAIILTKLFLTFFFSSL